MENDVEILKKISKEGVSWTHGQGYNWLNETLLPLIQDCKIEDKSLLSDCWYVIGDVYDFNDAPKMAITAYKKSIHFDEEHGEAYREIASMYERMGEYQKALENAKKALELNPDDEFSIEQYESASQELKSPSEPLYSEDDLDWQCNELLAENKPQEVIGKLINRRKIVYRKIRARSFGILKERDKYLQEWNMIVRNNQEIELDYADWFFMPDEIYYRSQFWNMLYERNNISLTGILPDYSSLYKNYRTSLDRKQMRRLVIKTFVLKNENNRQGLLDLAEVYPKWEEIKKLILDDEWGKNL